MNKLQVLKKLKETLEDPHTVYDWKFSYSCSVGWLHAIANNFSFEQNKKAIEQYNDWSGKKVWEEMLKIFDFSIGMNEYPSLKVVFDLGFTIEELIELERMPAFITKINESIDRQIYFMKKYAHLKSIEKIWVSKEEYNRNWTNNPILKKKRKWLFFDSEYYIPLSWHEPYKSREFVIEFVNDWIEREKALLSAN